MDCMEMNCHNEFHLEYCFICHSAPALAAFPSILLTDAFIYLLSIQYPFYSSFSPVTAADRSLLVPFQFPLKPSMPACTTTPICSAFEVTIGIIVLIVELHFLNASEKHHDAFIDVHEHSKQQHSA